MPESRNMFEQYLGAPVTSQCYKELGQKIKQYSESEREALIESFQPKELHLQLLKLTVARASGCYRPLLDGLKEESTFLSEFSLKSRLVFCGNNTELLDTNVLIPLLQTVSASTRNRILWNLGKHVSTGFNSKVSEADVDAIYNAVSKVWGSNIALPLLCQTSKEVIERELPNVTSLSKTQLLVIANKFPFLALAFLEQKSSTPPPQEAARYVVRKTIPKSFAYILKQDSSFLTKPMMKNILKNYSNVVLESPSAWLNVLNKRTVKKVLRPEHFELFLAKQILEIKGMEVPYMLLPYFEMLPPKEVSAILNKVFPEKYGSPLRTKLDFWEVNRNLLKLLDVNDRSIIAVAMNTKDPLSTDWLPLMTTDLSIPRIKKLLSTEQDALARARLVSQMIDTALLNKDQSAIEDICNFVVSKYRNDKPTLQYFFNSDLNFSSLSVKTFDLVFTIADRFYNPDDWQTQYAAKLFPIAIRRNWGESGLKQFLEHLMKNSPYFSVHDLDDLENELRPFCIEEVFSAANVEDEDKLRELATFLPLISQWCRKSSLVPLINNNVKKCVLKLLESDIDRYLAIEFVCANLKTLNLEFIENCFQHVLEPKLLAHLFHKKSKLVSTEETLKRVGQHIMKVGVNGFVTLLAKLKKLGYTDMLQYLATESKAALADTDADKVRNCTHAVILLMLTCPADDFFSTIDPFLPSAENNKVDTPKASGDGGKHGRYCPLRATKREDAIYYGFGMSISHLEIPALAVERLRRFCVGGDLVLFVRDALYSVSSSLPNDKAKMFLLSLMKQPVSVRKHALRLLWRDVCNIETQEVLLLKLSASENHLTMRIILMNTAISSLNICKYSSMWRVVHEMINKLTADDKIIVLEIMNKRVPDPFLEEFYKILLEKCTFLKDVENARMIGNVCQQISYVVTKMSEKFIETLIIEYFLSKMFIELDVYSHSSMCELLLGYLQGAPASDLPLDQSSEVVEPRKNLTSRQQFLKERLHACVIEGPRDVFDTKQGIYPVRRLLMTFVESFCDCCLVRHSKPSYEYQLTEYIDFLLSYFDQFSQNAIAWPYTILSSTKVLKVNTSESAFVVGQKLGELCDSMFLKHSVALFCYFPLAMAHFFNAFVNISSLFTRMQVIDILRGMLATVPSAACGTKNSPEDLSNMLRLMIVAHILPSHWVVDDEYKDFRQTFLVLVKNTPAEVFLFNAR